MWPADDNVDFPESSFHENAFVWYRPLFELRVVYGHKFGLVLRGFIDRWLIGHAAFHKKMNR